MIYKNKVLLKKSIVVAIIDSGIDFSNIKLRDSKEMSTGFSMTDTGMIIEDHAIKPRHEHGTAIALIIKQLCENVRFISVNILNERLVTDGRILIQALKTTIEYTPDIIHLSLGTTKWRYKSQLKKIVKLANSKNILIVSAADNQGHRSYPAYLKYVIGVKGLKYENYTDYDYKNGFFYASYSTNKIDGMNQFINKNMSGNSMAAGYITGHISKIKYRNFNKDNSEIIKILKLNTHNLFRRK